MLQMPSPIQAGSLEATGVVVAATFAQAPKVLLLLTLLLINNRSVRSLHKW